VDVETEGDDPSGETVEDQEPLPIALLTEYTLSKRHLSRASKCVPFISADLLRTDGSQVFQRVLDDGRDNADEDNKKGQLKLILRRLKLYLVDSRFYPPDRTTRPITCHRVGLVVISFIYWSVFRVGNFSRSRKI
jgi:hypothetical protein